MKVKVAQLESFLLKTVCCCLYLIRECRPFCSRELFFYQSIRICIYRSISNIWPWIGSTLFDPEVDGYFRLEVEGVAHVGPGVHQLNTNQNYSIRKILSTRITKKRVVSELAKPQNTHFFKWVTLKSK